MSDTHLTQTRFDSFPLDKRILAGLADAGFTHCTPIQALTLPLALDGLDVAGQAQTGTGKTAAFLLVLMQRLLSRPAPEATERARPRALVVAPTRELAVQIHRDALELGKHTGLRTAVVYGGTGYQSQRDELAAGVDILIGTPGRLLDYLRQKVFDLSAIEAVVLDEADRMFDLGFIKDIRFLLRSMPPRESRQGLLFSATLSYRVTELAYEHMNDPQRIEVAAEQVTADRVRQCCYMTANEDKVPLLIGLLRGWPQARCMVFVNTKRVADRVWGYLKGNGINAAVLSGDVPQPKRLALLRAFTEGRLPVLVGTDVAARGLHIPDVTHVINYDLPEDPEDYVHRIGRTARAGATGDAISFVCETYAFCLPDIEQYIGAQIPVQPVSSELLADIDPGSRVRPARADRQPRRDSDERDGSRSSRPGRSKDTRPAAPRSSRPPRAAENTPAPDVPAGDDRRTRGAPIEVPDMPRIRERAIATLAALTTPLKARPAAPDNTAPNAVAGDETASETTGSSRRRRRPRKPHADAQSGADPAATGHIDNDIDTQTVPGAVPDANPDDPGVIVPGEPSR